IGGVSVAVGNPAFLENVPAISGPFFDESQEVLRHYRWMLQKDTMGQDIFFIGPPGNLKRKLVLRYAQLAQREVEYVALSKDLTDGDLKQRREIKDGSAFYTDQACVRAAIHGRILILDGVEKAERNVLPILNNLLENREMSLDDGRFLVHPSRYDKLAATHSPKEMKKWKLKYEGHPLDPPLRSRFQARNINVPSFLSQMQHFIRLCPNVPQKTIERLVSVGMVLRAESNPVAAVSIPEFPTNMDAAIATLRNFPEINLRALLDCVFPFPLLSFVEDEQRSVIDAAYQRFYIRGPEIRTGSTSAAFQQADIGYRLKVVNPSKEPFVAPVEFDVTNGPDIVGKRTIKVPAGNLGPSAAEFFVQTEYHSALIATMLVCHVSTDICIIGEKGAGKSALLRAFTRLLGYTVEFIPLYKDMSARDLLQRRSTNSFGDTIWEHSPLVKGALAGSVVVLDQIEVLSFGALASLQRLISERAATLPDGTQLLPQDRYVELSKLPGYSQEVLTARKVYPVHPSFRVIAIARPTSSVSPRGTWLNPEITSMFMFVPMRPLAYTEEMEVIQTVCPGVDEVQLKKLLTFANLLRTLQDDTAKSLASALSTRQLIRIARRLALYPNDSLHDAIFKAALGRFLPSLAKRMLESLLAQNEFPNENKLADVDLKARASMTPVVRNSEGVEVLRIGEVSHPVATDTNPLLIPDIVYHDNVKQTEILREMLKDYTLGEHLLLIGNQGVGKNKLTDRFLQLLKLPREYIQLHRDTTVQSLTSTPTIVGGVLVYEDSPLVRAVKEGYVLVVDEADKAPTHVTSVLKSLVEDGEMVLRFPFLGNDFYREIGDVFATHCVDNPDSASEIQLLKKYAPSVAEDLLIKLSNAFTDLRRLVDEGLLNYPYSTRELVSVVKHLEAYPGEGLSRALGNVFDFDSYESDVRELLLEILAKHGIPTGLESDFKVGLGETWELPNALSLEVWNRKPVLKRDAVKCVVDRMQLHTRGGWPFAFGQNKSDLERVQGRTLVFSELVYSFRLPAKGEGIDILCSRFKPALTYALSSNPITLHVIDQRHLQSTPVDLYEYFPLQTRGPPGIELFEISQGKIGLHNPQDRMLLILNFQLQTISSISVSFVENLMNSTWPGVEVLHWPRPADDRAGDNGFLNLTTASRLLRVTKQIATVVPADNGKSEGWLEVVDPNKKTMRRLVVPLAIPVSAVAKNVKSLDMFRDYRFNGKVGTPRPVVAMSELPDGNLVTLDLSGTVRVWQVATSAIETDVKEWKRLVGTLDAETLSIVYGGEGKPPLNFAVRGEGEGEGEGNGTGNGQGDGGGTGGGGGASGGGGGGESTGSSQPPGGDGRKEGTVDLNTFNLRTINDVPKEVSDAQREMHSMAMKKRLDQLEMSQREMEAYTKYYANVQREIRELRVVLEATEAKNKERIWLRNQTTGDVDDTRLIEGVTGEKAVYKRRGDNDNDPSFQQKPKKMHFVFDLSASMMRFNGYDSRLDRSLECALLIMEAFKSFEHKFKYRISGHSGDGADIEFVTEGKYPKNEKDMFQVLAKMHSHAQYCLSGDNTLAATSLAVKNIVKEEADDYFVVILSDANITQYNLNPAALAKELKSNEKVNAFMVFIGSLQDQADQLVKAMPGSAYACLDTKELPKILKTIFMNSMLKGL
ncbi:AAA domain-containing protein, partial [Zopfochytrium polystomum]